MLLLQLLKFVLGITIGSFVAALSYRYPKSISNLKGRSFCDTCKHQISWYDNIPLLSYIFLNGKCRNCKSKISLRYPVIELASGIGFVLIGFQIIPLILFCILEIIFIIDLENQIIPDIFTFVATVLIFFELLISGGNLLFSSILSGFITSVFLLFIHLVTMGRGMGLGDVKFAVLGGMVIGLYLSPIWLFVAFLTGAATGIILILDRKAGLKSKIAFGPFLVLAIPITLVFGNAILKLIGL